jgi:release factor glutamine methyltransferase
LEYILGWVEFCGMRVAVTPGVFVPRRRTEVLVRESVQLLAAAGGEGPIALDLCCGSGAIAAAILASMPFAEVYATDVDSAALECARANVERAGGHVFAGDLFDALPGELQGRVSVVAANAPYVPTAAIALMPLEARGYEHRIALDGGHDGMDLHRRIAAEARTWLAPGGHLLIEAGRAQAQATARYMAEVGLAVRIVEDDEYEATVVVGTVVVGTVLVGRAC